MTESLTIKLTPQQFSYYQDKKIDLHAPDGTFLEHLGRYHRENISENEFFRTHEQLSLMACLLKHVDEPLTLSTPATMGLSALLHRTLGLLEKSLK